MGLPPARSPEPIRSCLCGRVLGRWADARLGTALVSEFPDSFPSELLSRASELVRRRDEVFAVTGEIGPEDIDEFAPGWAAEWRSLGSELAEFAEAALDQPRLSWVVSVPNGLLVGAHIRSTAFPSGRPPRDDEVGPARRVRPGMAQDVKLVGLDRLLLGAWMPPES